MYKEVSGVYNIDELMELYKTNKSGSVMLTSSRYAIKEIEDKYYVYNGERFLTKIPKVKRLIQIYGDALKDAIISVDYEIEGIPMFDKKSIEDAGLIPLHSKDITEYFEITDTKITHNTYNDDDISGLVEHIKNEDSIYYKKMKALEFVESSYELNSEEE